MWKSRNRSALRGNASSPKGIIDYEKQQPQRLGKRGRASSPPPSVISSKSSSIISDDLPLDDDHDHQDVVISSTVSPSDKIDPIEKTRPVLVEQETTSDELSDSFVDPDSDYDDLLDDDDEDSLGGCSPPTSATTTKPAAHTRDECDYFFMSTLTPSRKRSKVSAHDLNDAKTTLLHVLAAAGGDTTDLKFQACLDVLSEMYHSSNYDARDTMATSTTTTSQKLEGMWLTLSKPNYPDCLGQNATGDYLYSLGRMSFDIFRPTSLVCSIQGMFNPVNFVPDARVVESAPRALREEVQRGESDLRTYNIVTAFTIEPTESERGPSRPIRGLQTTFGYNLPDPNVPNRFSIWFTGGTIEVNDPINDGEEWSKIFGGKDVPRRHLTEEARVLAAKILMGAAVPSEMEEDGTLRFTFSRPIGGHGSHYVDVLYLDESLRIMRGHRGSVYVFSRVPTFPSAS